MCVAGLFAVPCRQGDAKVRFLHRWRETILPSVQDLTITQMRHVNLGEQSIELQCGC